MSTNQTALEVPDEWLPGDQVAGSYVWTRESDQWRSKAGAMATDSHIKHWVLSGETPVRITHLVPREPAPEPLPLGVPAGWVRRAAGDVIRAGEPHACMTGLHGIVTTYPTGPVGDLVVSTDGIAPAVEYYTAPPPEPKPWEDIPEGRENAALLSVNGVPGRYYRKGQWLALNIGGVEFAPGWRLDDVTSVEPLTVVPSELVERARDYLRKYSYSSMLGQISGGIIRDLAKAGESE